MNSGLFVSVVRLMILRDLLYGPRIGNCYGTAVSRVGYINGVFGHQDHQAGATNSSDRPLLRSVPLFDLDFADLLDFFSPCRSGEQIVQVDKGVLECLLVLASFKILILLKEFGEVFLGIERNLGA